MKFYHLHPSPDLSTRETNIATWTGGFTEQEISKIISIGEELVPERAVTTSPHGFDVNPKVRESKVSWIEHSSSTNFIYEKLGYICRTLNGQFFDFDVTGIAYPLQYTTYRASGDVSGHYDWHMDKGDLSSSPRKLSLTLQLSNPSEYEGGELQFFVNALNVETASKEKGMIYLFPSYILHRVTPVTAGIRRSLVVWFSGPKFR